MKWDGDFGTAVAAPAKRPPIGGMPSVVGPATGAAGRLADLLPYPLVVPVWGVPTKSEANVREHHMARYRRFKAQRRAVGLALKPLGILLGLVGAEVGVGGRLVVTMCRFGPRRLDSDNLAGALKAVRDEVAGWLGVDDGHAGIEWQTEQRRGEDGVIITIQSATPETR